MEYINTTIVGSDANAFFGENNAPLGSVTLGATLRFIALKHHRGDIETIKPIKFETGQFYEQNNGNIYAKRAKDNNIELYILSAPRRAQLPIIDEDGWVSLDTPPYPVAPFLSTKSETHIYTNTTIQSTVIFVRQASEKWIDALCSSMFRVLSWYFTDGITDDETALFKAISKQDSKTFNSIVNSFCENIDFKGKRFRKTLIGWNDGYRKQQIEALRADISNLHDSIENYQQEIARRLNDISKNNTNLIALMAQENSSDDSVYNFFINHKNISIISTRLGTSNGNVMDYSIRETLEYYDTDDFIRLYNNSGSAIGGANENIKKVLYAIFADNKGMLRVESMFRLVNLSSVTVLKRTSSGECNYTHLLHPHLVHFGCLGNNGGYITKFLRQGNWDMAIEQTIAATKNINFGDATVIGQFISDIRSNFDSDGKFIVADNGKEMSFREFLSYISETTENEGTENG